MEALRDPFSRVHPFFWPVLWLSLRAFVRWTRAMIEAGHGYGGLHVEITWYGRIHVRAVDLSETGKAFRRHMMGAAREDGWGVLARACGRVETLLSPHNTPHSREGGNPWLALAAGSADCIAGPWIPACVGTSAISNSFLKTGISPPISFAPLPQAGRGAAPISRATRPFPPRAGAPAG